MIKELLQIGHGAVLWRGLQNRLKIHYKKVVLVLVNENPELDYYALRHLEDYMHRKCAKEAILLFSQRQTGQMIQRLGQRRDIKAYKCPEEKIQKLYGFYSFYKFFDNIVFTYASKPKDNQLGRVLKETSVNEEDAVCLGLYHLRKVPVHKTEHGE
nr:hypothetical protein [uncultured Schaedlerella sp.]